MSVSIFVFFLSESLFPCDAMHQSISLTYQRPERSGDLEGKAGRGQLGTLGRSNRRVPLASLTTTTPLSTDS